MKIAIIGKGFAAAAASHYLSPFSEVTLFEDGAGSASSVAAGLLHKFVGMHAKKSLFADEALPLALDLIEPKVKTSLIRKAQSEEQAAWFRKSASNYPEEIKLIDPFTILIKEAWIVDCPKYLSKLKSIRQTITHLSELEAFDHIIIAAGASSKSFCDLPLSKTRGQLLEVKGGPLPSLPHSSHIYALPHKEHLIVGSTYERSEKVDAKKELLPKLKEVLPDFEVEEVLCVKEGFRATLPGRMPLIKQLSNKTWVFTGLGSKGLLYHAYFGKKLAEMLFNLPHFSH